MRVLNDEEIAEAVGRYVCRDDAALAEEKKERRAGRPMSTRQKLLEQVGEYEKKEYETGLWMPDLRDQVTVENLVGWRGEWNGLAQMKFVRTKRDGVIKDSAFPPSGAA